MKKFLLLIISLILLFVSCGPAPDHENSEGAHKARAVGKCYHHNSANCNGHDIYVTKTNIEEDGHDMWLYSCFVEGHSDTNTITVIHSPDCKKCNPETKSILDNLSSSSTSSWGW